MRKAFELRKESKKSFDFENIEKPVKIEKIDEKIIKIDKVTGKYRIKEIL